MSIREQLLGAFAVPAGTPLSGESLAARFRVSRVAVWKHVQALSAMGFPIQSSPRSGYRLSPPFDASLSRYAKSRQGWITPHYFLNTHTTQRLAKEGGAAGLPEGHLWIAEVQTKGRGRLERVWESSYGGLWFSLLLRPSLPAARVPPLTLLAGLCLRDAIAKVYAVNASLKWPNDVLVNSRKVAGILTEMSGQIDRTDWVVMGIGVNIANPLSKALKNRAATLADISGKMLSRQKLIECFLTLFKPAYQRFLTQGFEPFQTRYWSHYCPPKSEIRIQTGNGLLRGKARGIDASGAILIESRRKILAISEGEIIL